MWVRIFLKTARFTLLLVLFTTPLFACSSKPALSQREANSQTLSDNNADATTRSHIGRAAADLALEQIGVPYRYGGASPSGFDCSGLVQYVYGKLGIALPHKARKMAGIGRRISVDSLQPGDLLFFNIKGSRASHVGIHVNRGEFVHATKTGDPVRVDTLTNPWWRKRLMVARRVY